MDELIRFVQSENFKLYASRLELESDGPRRENLRRLLLEEERRYGFHAEQLDMADLHIIEVRRRIERQRQLVRGLEDAARDTAEALKLLTCLTETLDLFESFRSTVVAALAHDLG